MTAPAQRQTTALLRAFEANLYRVAETGTADDIHDLRVSIRRLSRALRVFAPLYPDRSWKKIRVRLHRAMQLAGAVRDRDIALECLGNAGVSPRAAVITRLKTERRQAGEELQAEMRRWKERGVIARWAAQLVIPPRTDPTKAGSPLPLAAAYFAEVRNLLAHEPRPKDLHRARLATKRFRYSLELYRRYYGTGLETRLAALRKVQQLLGNVNDSVASWRLLSRLPGPFPQRLAVREFLKQEAGRHAGAFRKEWEEAFDAPGREDWWTAYLKNRRKSP